MDDKKVVKQELNEEELDQASGGLKIVVLGCKKKCNVD